MTSIAHLSIGYPHYGGEYHVDFVCTSDVFEFDNAQVIAALREMVERGVSEFDDAVAFAKQQFANTREQLTKSGEWPPRDGQCLALRLKFRRSVRFRALTESERAQHLAAHASRPWQSSTGLPHWVR